LRDPQAQRRNKAIAPYELKQASDKLPEELDEAAYIDGASALQLFRDLSSA
jgi:ABC-type glycerol-3-phosphate transport system permease component